MITESISSYDVCGVAIAALRPISAAECIIGAAAHGEKLEVHLCNAYTLSLVRSNHELRRVLAQSDLNLPDGTPVAWLGRSHGVRGPVRGPRLVGDVVDRGRHAALRHYFFGAAPGVAAAMASALESRYPGAQTAGTESPPYGHLGDSDIARAAERIKKSGAQLLWVGLGTPRQDYVVPRLAAYLKMPVIPVGAAFDFWAGSLPQAPSYVHGTGFEWVFRLAAEPRRLWRRYLVGNPRFVANAVRHRMSR